MAILKHTKLITKIVEEIKNQIIRGELQAGQKLPPQDKWAKEMGISRGTLREALNQLVLIGIIEMKQGNGTYVKSITPSSFMESLSLALIMDKSSVSELLDARLCIESAVAFWAAKKASTKDMQELKKTCQQMREAYQHNNTEEFIKKDLEFHILIAKSSKNRVLMRVVQTIREVLYQFIADFFSLMPDTMKNALNYHTRILKAIENQNPEKAKKEMEAHIISLIRRLNNLHQDLDGAQIPSKN